MEAIIFDVKSGFSAKNGAEGWFGIFSLDLCKPTVWPIHNVEREKSSSSSSRRCRRRRRCRRCSRCSRCSRCRSRRSRRSCRNSSNSSRSRLVGWLVGR